jgi:hypothetical protein
MGTHMKLFGVVNLLIDTLLRFEIDGLKTGLNP